MRVEYFRFLMKRRYAWWDFDDGVRLCGEKPITIKDEEAGFKQEFKTLDDALNFEYKGKTIKDRVLALSNELPVDVIEGGRGSSSGGGGRRGNSRSLLPAIANTRIRAETVDAALADFRKNHMNSNIEYAYAMNSVGDVYAYTQGNEKNVSPYVDRVRLRRGEKATVVHNHPNGSAFSQPDLRYFGQNGSLGMLVASGKNFDYAIKKSGHFKGEAFTSAMNAAYRKIDRSTNSLADYNDQMDTWLRGNAKKYGYTYKRTSNR